MRHIRRQNGQWQLFDANDRLIAQAATLVLANAADALRLCGTEHWPVQQVRGQLSLFDQAGAAEHERMALPRLPLAGDGYVLPDIDGMALFGASAQADDADPAVRAADHAWNLQRLQRLCPQSEPIEPQRLQGQMAWRCVSDDRLPIIGSAPDEAAAAACEPRGTADAPRREGLYVFTALGSRGISWAALGAQVLAAQMSGTPAPLPASLIQRIDPARFMLRRARRGG